MVVPDRPVAEHSVRDAEVAAIPPQDSRRRTRLTPEQRALLERRLRGEVPS